MNVRRLRGAVALAALAGVGIASYLSYTRLAGGSLICPTDGCATVQRSAYSKLGGVPVAYLGVVAYGAILATAASARRLAAFVGAGLSVGALAFALYLLVVQLVVIDAVCMWCLASDVVALTLAVLSILVASGRPRAPGHPIT